MTQWAPWIATSALIVVAAGCNNQVAVYPVHGKITFEGKPLAGGGAIAFVPLTDQPGKTAAGEIAEDGTYRMTTHKDGDGSMAGEFRVVIMQTVDREPERTADGQAAARPALVVPLAERIPAIYANHYESPLTCKVEAQNSNELNFDLRSK